MSTNEDPSGAVVPEGCRWSRGIWPTCFGYIRGHCPSPEEVVLTARATMTHYCEQNELHLALIFHDWQVEPNRLKYPGLLHAIDSALQPDTHSLFLADLDFVREPSSVLTVLVQTLLQARPELHVRCFVQAQALSGWSRGRKRSTLRHEGDGGRLVARILQYQAQVPQWLRADRLANNTLG